MIDFTEVKSLADKFQKETQFNSFTKKSDTCYQKLISFGKDVVPFFIDNLETYNWLALSIIRDLIDEKDLPSIDNATEAGRLNILIKKYKDWWKEYNVCSNEAQK